MKPLDYNPPKPSYIMRLLWSAAGGDEMILKHSTYADQVKYMCLGGIIVATGLMAGIAGGYAFYTIFEPKGGAIDYDGTHIPTMISSLIFGSIWGAIIFNIDRFIVSSTGKGDGTEAITWSEFKGAIPRIIMGLIISITISKPVEIRMFKSEIDAELHQVQLEKRKTYEEKTKANYSDRLALIDDEIAEFTVAQKDLVNRVKMAEKEHMDQLQGRAGAAAGDGKLSRALDKIKSSLVLELENFKGDIKIRRDELNSSRRELIGEMNLELSKNKEVASGLDGLLERIKLAHVLAGTWISLFITLLFMAIELTPIFFKLMLIKSPYDYIEENIKELAKANAGIHITYDYYTDDDKQGIERHLVRNLNSEKIINDKLSLLDSQKRLTEYAIQKFEEKIKKQIDENPEEYISFGDEQPNNDK